MDVVMTEVRLTPDANHPVSGRARATDALDLGEVFEAHAAPLYRTILAYTGGRADVAEEAVGEAFARASAHPGALRDPVAWLYRVAFNVANDEFRRERRHGAAPQAERPEPPHEFAGLFDALKQLPPRERAVMVLFYVLDLPVAEVADRMGLASATVRVHLTRGRRRLAALLGDDEVND
jgi:RNA polymerase sigma-70 factor (ECF subfamily)